MQTSSWTDWYNSLFEVEQTTWQYRMMISVDNRNCTDTLYDYQIQITTNTKSLIEASPLPKMKPDCSDILVCDSDGKTVINHWRVESTTGTTNTKIWIKIPVLPASTLKNIYLYYGNSSTTSTLSNRDAVFDLYEDWEKGAIDTSKWEIGGNHPFRIAISSGYPDGIHGDSAYEGKYAVASSTITGNQNSYIKRTVSVLYPSVVSFWWAVSSEGGSDKLSFLIGADVKDSISGQIISWAKKSGDLASAGTYDLKWIYEKDFGTNQGHDRGWVDLITITRYASTLPSVLVGKEEKWAPYYTGTTAPDPAAMYWSDIVDTKAENSGVKKISWTVVGTESDIVVYMRVSNTAFSDPTPTALTNWTSVLNDGAISSRGRYIQYHARFLSDGQTTPSLSDISIRYETPPKRPTEFSGNTISTSTLLWTWKDNDPAFPQETGYRVYAASSAKAIPANGFIEYSETQGLVKNLPADTTYWYEENLKANTPYGRFVVAYNTEGGNVATRLTDVLLRAVTKYTYALPPAVQSEYYFDDDTIPGDGGYTKISTGVWSTDKYFRVSSHTVVPTGNFTSNISTSVGTLQYYRVYWGTTSVYEWSGTETIWQPSTTTVVELPSGANIQKKGDLLLRATTNSDSWYFHIRSYNADNEPTPTGNISSSVVLGPYYFCGAPARITNLIATPSTVEEGAVILTWTAPTADATFNNLVGGKFIIKYREGLVSVTDASFDALPGVTVSTSATAGQTQRYVIPGLTPGATYWFAVKSEDSEGNISGLSTNLDNIIYMRTRAAKVAKIVF